MATYTPKKTVTYSSWQAKRHVHIYHAPLADATRTVQAEAKQKSTTPHKAAHMQ